MKRERGPDFHVTSHVLCESEGARPHLNPVGNVVCRPSPDFLACLVKRLNLVQRPSNLDLQATLIQVNYRRFLRWTGMGEEENDESEPHLGFFFGVHGFDAAKFNDEDGW